LADRQDNVKPAGGRPRKARPRDEVHGPSPDPATNLAIADIALRGGAALVRNAVEKKFLGRSMSPRKAARLIKGRSMTESLIHGALARVALRSVPGAILVGGALVAKTLYDRGKARKKGKG
jgi:hypothetical protein